MIAFKPRQPQPSLGPRIRGDERNNGRLSRLRRGATTIALALVALPLAACHAQTPPPPKHTVAGLPPYCDSVPPASQALRGAASFDYRPVGGRVLRIHVFSPDGGGAHRPAALMFFGGGFQNGDVDSLERQAKSFADHGYVAAIADYRVFCRDATRPADAFEDAGDARDWMRANAAKLGIDPGRLVLVGESSGGALAAATALRALPEARPTALVLFNPVTDLRVGPWAAQMTPDQLSSFSPSLLPAAALPPTIVFHGIADHLVPIATARAFCDRAQAAGRTCRLVEYPGEDHSFYQRKSPLPGVGASPFDDTLAKTFAFLSGTSARSRGEGAAQ